MLSVEFTDVGVVWPGIRDHDCPGARPNVVPLAVVPAVPTGLTNSVDVAVAGLVMKPPFGLGPTAVTAVPPVVTTETRPGPGVTAGAAMGGVAQYLTAKMLELTGGTVANAVCDTPPFMLDVLPVLVPDIAGSVAVLVVVNPL